MKNKKVDKIFLCISLVLFFASNVFSMRKDLELESKDPNYEQSWQRLSRKMIFTPRFGTSMGQDFLNQNFETTDGIVYRCKKRKKSYLDEIASESVYLERTCPEVNVSTRKCNFKNRKKSYSNNAVSEKKLKTFESRYPRLIQMKLYLQKGKYSFDDMEKFKEMFIQAAKTRVKNCRIDLVQFKKWSSAERFKRINEYKAEQAKVKKGQNRLCSIIKMLDLKYDKGQGDTSEKTINDLCIAYDKDAFVTVKLKSLSEEIERLDRAHAEAIREDYYEIDTYDDEEDSDDEEEESSFIGNGSGKYIVGGVVFMVATTILLYWLRR